MKTINYNDAKIKLSKLWFISAAIIILLMMFLTLDKLQNHQSEAWGWMFSNILPTLSLIISVFVFDIKKSTPEEIFVNSHYYSIAFWISSFYFLIIVFILLGSPFAKKPIIEWMQDSNLFLGPIQGIVTGAVGMFFIKKN